MHASTRSLAREEGRRPDADLPAASRSRWSAARALRCATQRRRYLDCSPGSRPTPWGTATRRSSRPSTAQAHMILARLQPLYTEPMVALAEWIRGRSSADGSTSATRAPRRTRPPLKLARKRQSRVVALVNGFHGRTYGALSLTGQPGEQSPLVPGVRHVERDDLEGMEAAVGPATCAIFLEVVQGEVGVHPVPDAMGSGSRASWPSRHGALRDHRRGCKTGLRAHRPAVRLYQDVRTRRGVLAKSLGGASRSARSSPPAERHPAAGRPRSRSPAAPWRAPPPSPRARCSATPSSSSRCASRAPRCSPASRGWSRTGCAGHRGPRT